MPKTASRIRETVATARAELAKLDKERMPLIHPEQRADFKLWRTEILVQALAVDKAKLDEREEEIEYLDVLWKHYLFTLRKAHDSSESVAWRERHGTDAT